MDMQREDFLRLCKPPERVYKAKRYGHTFDVRLFDGMDGANTGRVILDWFPIGSVVQLKDVTYISRGSVREDYLTYLHLLDSRNLEVKKLSVVEALTLAEIRNKEPVKWP